MAASNSSLFEPDLPNGFQYRADFITAADEAALLADLGRLTFVAPRRQATHELRLEPRSAYVMRDDARMQYEHHIPPVTSLRYSITFRTLR